jgi:SAM-dependent methyltransferase
VESSRSALAQYFDDWYAGMPESPVKDEIQQRHLGLPAYLLSTSLLTWAGIAEVTDALRLSPGGTLLDLACGRGGYGLEIAARTGARLVGADFSAEAVRQARQQARRQDRTAGFAVADLAATGLGTGAADAVLCVDAIQFAPEPDAAYRELRRVLAAAGFSGVEVTERPGWRAAERAMWEEAAALDPGDDSALQSFHAEGIRSLETFTRLRRVMATASA